MMWPGDLRHMTSIKKGDITMLKDYFDRCGRNHIVSLSTIANVKAFQDFLQNGVCVETNEKDFNQSVRLKSSKTSFKLGHLKNKFLVNHPSIILDVQKKTNAACHVLIVGNTLLIK